MAVLLGRKGFILTFSIVLGTLTGATKAAGQCGCMDIALIIDDSGSMGGAIDNVKSELPAIIATAQAVAGSDLRIGVVSFPNVAGLTNSDGVTVRQGFTSDTTLINNAVQSLAASGGIGEPESSDAALQFVVDGTTDTGCIISNTPLGSFRSGCTKIAVLITDAHPGGCHDSFTVGVDDVHAAAVATNAAAAGVLVAAIYVPVGGENPEVKAIMQNYASVTGGTFVQTSSDGTGTGQGIVDMIASSIPTVTNSLITRTSRFWFTHAYSSNCTCVTLLKAIQLNGGTVDLGFVNLPTANRNADNATDANDALIEALGFDWRSTVKTGEAGGTQSQKLKGSGLCKARKELAAELIAAIANTSLFGTQPSNATYVAGGIAVNFPADLIQQARTAASSDDINTVRAITPLLSKFNSSGQTNDFPAGLVECSAQKSKDLKQVSRDPTTQITCPGVNTTCDSAEAVAFPNSSDPFASAIFKRSVSLSKFIDSVLGPSCGAGGRDATWQVKPAVGTTGRQFTVSTDGSNFDTMISVWTGTCSNLLEVTGGCTNGVAGIGGEHLSFTTDGTNTFRIVVEGASGNYGKLKLKITSP